MRRLVLLLLPGASIGTGPAWAVQAPSGQPAVEVVVVDQDSGVDHVLQAVSPVSDEVVWITGHAGVALRTLNGGRTWGRLPSPAADTLQFRDVHAFSDRTAVVLSSGDGALSRIYRTDDGGETWALAFLMDEPTGFLDCLDFWDLQRGFAYGDAVDGRLYILVTGDGGRSWRRPDPQGVPGAQPGEGGFAASGTCARAAAGGRGWIATGAGTAGRLLATRDYGRRWESIEVPMARGAAAGLFTIAMGEDGPVMVLGGDLERADQVVANAAVRDGAPGAQGPWTAAVRPAPVPGAVYGSGVSRSVAPGRDLVVAFAPTASAFTLDGGRTWHELSGVAAWTGAFAPSGRTGWAAGAGGRIWRIEPKAAPGGAGPERWNRAAYHGALVTRPRR